MYQIRCIDCSVSYGSFFSVSLLRLRACVSCFVSLFAYTNNVKEVTLTYFTSQNRKPNKVGANVAFSSQLNLTAHGIFVVKKRRFEIVPYFTYLLSYMR